jgi:Ger(x)C family germination protein
VAILKKSKILILMAVILSIIIAGIGSKGEPVENLGIVVGIGNDIEKKGSDISYNISYLLYSFDSGNKIIARVLPGKGNSTGETRESRQLASGKKLQIGLSKLFVFSQDNAESGLRNILDISLNNPEINDRAECVVCKGKAEDMLNYQVKGFQSSVDFIEGMIKNLQEYNFFSDQYSLMDLNVRVDAEGRNSLLPYVEIKDDSIETTGLAIFKKDIMVAKTDMSEAKIINMLKGNDVKGLLTLQNGSKYINCYTTAKNKITCSKEDGKYKFIINLNLKGNIVSNELYDSIETDPKVMKRFEADMTNYVQKMSNDFINKSKCQYKTDVLDLGRIAAAKYGICTGTDWNEVICNSDIEVNVKFAVDGEGRGDY